MTSWVQDRNDPRVIAALEKPCHVCQARPGIYCNWAGAPIRGGLIHNYRVPESVLFAESAR